MHFDNEIMLWGPHLGDEAVWVWEAVRSFGDLGELAPGGAGESLLVEFCVVEAACRVQDGADGVCLLSAVQLASSVRSVSP